MLQWRNVLDKTFMANIPDKSPDQLGATEQLKSMLETPDFFVDFLLADHFFGPASAHVMRAAPAAAAEPVEEQTKFDVILYGFDSAAKIKVVKAVREATGLGLGEAKALVEAAPKLVKEGVTRAEAEAVKDHLEQAGAKVNIPHYHEELYAKHNSQQVEGYILNRIDNIFVELARIDHRISQNQIDIDDLKAETRELLSTLRVSNL